ncbi:hypothetical protein EC991775_2495, partial [Escherichia coli 99.1775]
LFSGTGYSYKAVMKANLEPVALKELVRNLTEFAVC